MNDSVTRFSNRVDNYAKYRPAYPAAVIDILWSECGLKETSVVADVGSGTGILSELFLNNGNKVFGVEPNDAMRLSGEQRLRGSENFVSVAATAEATTLEPGVIDFVTAGQAFHWFDRGKARIEFARILRPGGWVVLIWNERRLDSTPFLRDYENLLLRFGTDYENVRHENVAAEIPKFFAPATFQLKTLENAQYFDFESLTGRVISASYTPEPGHPDFAPMLAGLKAHFKAHERGGIITFEYETKIYYGQLEVPAS